MEVKRCFADRGDYCTALRKKECENCKFYKSDLQIANIEWDIQNYDGGKKNENI